ncbi:hypothetical protein BDEG_21454 [Batrachochytrium dendrobatidis JEL423]|nr:hypothetical protein BDEG_21454 [Batrachochytrium dendrobatidis JEL423]
MSRLNPQSQNTREHLQPPSITITRTPSQRNQERRSTLIRPDLQVNVNDRRSSYIQPLASASPQSAYLSPDTKSPASATALLPRKSSVRESIGIHVQIPVKKRKYCNDAIWLLLFLCATGGMATISYMAFTRGYYQRLLYERDSEGSLCGTSAGEVDSSRDLSGQPYIAYYNLSSTNSFRRCISSCPDLTDSFSSLICQYGMDPPDTASTSVRQALVAAGNCTLTHASTPVVDFNHDTFAAMLFQQIALDWWILIVSMSITLVLSYSWIFLLVIMSRFIVWATLWLVLLVAWGGSGFLLYMYISLQYYGLSPLSSTISAAGGYYTASTLLTLTCIVFIISVAISISSFFFRKTIALAIRIIIETSNSFRKLQVLSTIPLAKTGAVIFLGLYTVFIVSLLSTVGKVVTPITRTYTLHNSTYTVPTGRVFVPSIHNNYFQCYAFVWFLWLYNVVHAVGAVSVAGVIGENYFTLQKEDPDVIHQSMKSAVARVFLSHFGSTLFGSISIPLIKVINIVNWFISSTFSKVEKIEVAKTKDLFFDRWYRWLGECMISVNEKAYITMALFGHPFCESARLGVRITEQNSIRHVNFEIFELKVVSGVSGVVMFFGKVLITLAAGSSGVVLVCTVTQKNTPTSTLAPIFILLFILSYLVASVIIEPFTIAIETVFICLCVDLENNSGGANGAVSTRGREAFKKFDIVSVDGQR